MKENKTLQRYEFKYFIRKRIAEEIQEHASKFMLLDSHAHSTSNNQYFVRSIYFEDDFHTNNIWPSISTNHSYLIMKRVDGLK